MIDNRTAPYAALLLRVALGAALLAHGALKVFVFTVPGTVQFFESIGYPGFLAYLVILAEFGYDGKIMETFPFDQAQERYSMWALKAYGLPSMYWHGMLRGRM